jgi:hypothetical protein
VDSRQHAQTAAGVAPRPPAAQAALPAHPEPSRSLRPWWLAVSLCAAWLVPLALNELRLDVILPVALLLAVASVLRSGTNVVDRLMLSAALLAGAILALGLLFSVWPWGLHPVPVAGTCFSLVVVVSWLTHRRPSLPRRWLGSDLVVLGSGIVAFCAAYAPVAGLSPAKRLAFSTITTDRFNHFALFDTIDRLGGYTLFHQSQARLSVQTPTEVVYPAGMHFLFALFDTFLRSATGPGAVLPEYSRYFSYVMAAYAFLVMALVWAARWVAGPRLAGWRRFVICGAVAALAIGGPLVKMIEYGLDSDILGLAFLALGVAVAARPPRIVVEHVLIAGALLIAVAYCYNLFAVPLGLGMGAAAIVYRHRLRRHLGFTLIAAAAACALAFYPSAVSLASGFNAQALTLAHTGWYVPLPGPLLAGLALVTVVATMASAASRRLPVSQAMTAQLLVSAIVIGAFAVYQLSEMHRTSYYFNKLLVAGYVTCLVGLGGAGSLLRPLRARASRASRGAPVGRATWLREARLAAVAGVAGVAAVIVATLFQAGLSGGRPLVWVGSRLANWSAGKVTAQAAPSLVSLAGAHLLGDRVPTLVFVGNKHDDLYDSYFSAAANRDLGTMTRPINAVFHFIFNRRDNVDVGGQEILAAQRALDAGVPRLRFITRDPVLAARLRALAAAHPGVDATVLLLPNLRG